jgi:hypothetical protein
MSGASELLSIRTLRWSNLVGRKLMLKRTMTAALLVALVITAGSASAQCVMGAYADAAGMESVTAPFENQLFDIFVILRDEAAVEGVSYKVTFPTGVFATQSWYGPNEAGFPFLTPNGIIVGFGECAIGFGGFDIQVAHYAAIATVNTIMNEYVTLEANIDENPLNVEYATCSGNIIECLNVQPLLISHVIANESKSFGAVKSLY